jgi:hypothetical protein
VCVWVKGSSPLAAATLASYTCRTGCCWNQLKDKALFRSTAAAHAVLGAQRAASLRRNSQKRNKNWIIMRYERPGKRGFIPDCNPALFFNMCSLRCFIGSLRGSPQDAGIKHFALHFSIYGSASAVVLCLL